jgi:HEAT repeat protein
VRRSALPLLLVVLGAGAAAQPRDVTTRCREACERHVTAPRQRASACGACVLAPGDAAAWLPRLPAPPEGLLADPDWQVRWAALLSRARAAGTTAPKELGAWLATARGEERQRACQTALHGAAGLRLTLDALLEPARSGLPAAAPRCEALVPALLEAEATRLYSMDPVEQNEALRHPALALGRAPARLTLDALARRPAALDEAGLAPLLRWSESEGTALGYELGRAATPADVAVMNRALAVAGRLRDAAREAARTDDAVARRRAVQALANLAPWTEGELLEALADPAPGVRLAAARGLARGEGRPLGPAVAARLDGSRPATPAQQAALLALLVETSDPACAEVALAAWAPTAAQAARGAAAPADAGASTPGEGAARPPANVAGPALRAQALVAAAACGAPGVRALVLETLRSPEPLFRAAAVRALGFGAKDEAARAALAAASADPQGPVRAAASEAITQQRWRQLAPLAQARLGDEVAAVRAAALGALAALEAPGAEASLCAALERDPDALVRAAAARHLARFAGPRVLGALGAAARGDANDDVKLVAGESLRKLGAGSPTP